MLHKIAEVQGGYEVVYPYEGQERPSFAKQLADFEAGDLDVMWTLANRKYEEDYQAIYYPLYYGMFGLRLPIVKNENLHMFRGVKTLNDLKRFKVGQGLGWADTDILQANGLDVVPVTKYPNHFPMLEGERFDYFPRAMHEPWSEVKAWSKYNLTVDPHIVIRYKVGFYFFVKKKDVALIRYLNEGMAKLEENGMHKQIFLADEEVQMAFRNSNLENRIVIDLANPELTKNTPSDDSGLWLDINNLDEWLRGQGGATQE
ncbi:transporter substrate-binding domain-containing protein [Saccharophagus degradans]|uniref:transporter substrate-binding domain-containing protein n=1 Tax=Saccharophagus degradans TaxID=86304 RepID=UPI0013053BED|nr:transporter substrate-binding domain-containing protein [Saccharophagus degradans]